jgi:hypothetical protein
MIIIIIIIMIIIIIIIIRYCLTSSLYFTKKGQISKWSILIFIAQIVIKYSMLYQCEHYVVFFAGICPTCKIRFIVLLFCLLLRFVNFICYWYTENRYNPFRSNQAKKSKKIRFLVNFWLLLTTFICMSLCCKCSRWST